MNRRRDDGTGWRGLTSFSQLKAHVNSDFYPSLKISLSAWMIVDEGQGLAGDTELVGKRWRRDSGRLVSASRQVYGCTITRRAGLAATDGRLGRDELKSLNPYLPVHL